MDTLKALKARLADAEQRLSDIRRAPENDPECVRLRHLACERSEAVRTGLSGEYDRVQQEVCDLQGAIAGRAKSAAFPYYPALTEFMRRLKVGVDWSDGGKQWALIWASDGGRFAAVTKPSGTCWQGRGIGARYVPARHIMFDLDCGGGRGGLTLMKEAMVAEEVGRLSEQKLDHFKKLAQDRAST